MTCSRCDVYDEQLSFYALLLAMVYIALNWQNLLNVLGFSLLL